MCFATHWLEACSSERVAFSLLLLVVPCVGQEPSICLCISSTLSRLRSWLPSVVDYGVLRETVGSPDSISTKDLKEKTHQLPISVMIKERRLRWLVYVVRSDNNMVELLLFAPSVPGHVQPVGRPFGTFLKDICAYWCADWLQKKWKKVNLL